MKEQLLTIFEACHPFGYPLLACSLLLVTGIIYHLMNRTRSWRIEKLQELAQSFNSGQDAQGEQLLQYCLKSPHTPLNAEILLLYSLRHASAEEIENRIGTQLRLHIDSQRAGMTLVSIIKDIAPMLGILGTAWGLVSIFGVFGMANAQSSIALGISQALYTTIIGLAIAVPGIVALTFFERKLEQRAARIEALFAELIANRPHF